MTRKFKKVSLVAFAVWIICIGLFLFYSAIVPADYNNIAPGYGDVFGLLFIAGVIAFIVAIASAFFGLVIKPKVMEGEVVLEKGKNKIHINYLFLIPIVLAAWFWWFQIRPSQIRSGCSGIAKEKAIAKANNQGKFAKGDYDVYYEICLHEKGLK